MHKSAMSECCQAVKGVRLKSLATARDEASCFGKDLIP